MLIGLLFVSRQVAFATLKTRKGRVNCVLATVGILVLIVTDQPHLRRLACVLFCE